MIEGIFEEGLFKKGDVLGGMGIDKGLVVGIKVSNDVGIVVE